MPAQDPNPYVSPDDESVRRDSVLRQAIARLFSLGIFGVSLLPTFYIVHGLSIHYDFFLAHPDRSYRPMLFVLGLPLSIFTAVFLVISAAIFTGLGCEKDATLLMNLGIPLSFLPFALSIFGPLVICYLTGASLGS